MVETLTDRPVGRNSWEGFDPPPRLLYRRTRRRRSNGCPGAHLQGRCPGEFAFAASGRELRHFNEIALGLVFLTAALIIQFTTITNTHIGR
jgi:hypothetical protein